MSHRLVGLVALMLVAFSAGGAMAKRQPVQRTIAPRVAVHYYHAKPPHRTFTRADAPRRFASESRHETL